MITHKCSPWDHAIIIRYISKSSQALIISVDLHFLYLPCLLGRLLLICQDVPKGQGCPRDSTLAADLDRKGQHDGVQMQAHHRPAEGRDAQLDRSQRAAVLLR